MQDKIVYPERINALPGDKVTLDAEWFNELDRKARAYDSMTKTQIGDVRTVEQVIRDILTAAIQDGIVEESIRNFADPDPQIRTAGELVSCGNILSSYLSNHATSVNEARKKEDVEVPE